MTWMLMLAAMPAQGASPLDALRDEWWAIEKHVADQLQDRNVSQWARELSGEPWSDGRPANWMISFNVIRRAGHEEALSRLIDGLVKAEHPPNKGQLEQMVLSLIGGKQWDSAQQFCERMPEAHPRWGSGMVRHWEEVGRDPIWIDDWLVAREREDPPNEEGHDYLNPSQLRFWFSRRLEYRRRQGTAGLLISVLDKAVRDHPEDAGAAHRYLAAVKRVNTGDYDTAWIGTVVKPNSMVHCLDLGRSLTVLNPKAAVSLFQRSLEVKYSADDQRIMEQRTQRSSRMRGFAPRSFERMLRDAAYHELMYVYQKMGDAKKAQALLEELTQRYPDGIPPLGMAQFAGLVQGMSGARVIESRVRQAEPENRDSYKYWRQRGQYFAGRKERGEAIKAYEKALELAQSEPYEIEQGQGENFARALVLGDYVRLLGFNANGMRLLWREQKMTDPQTVFAKRIIRMMLDIEHDNTFFMQPDDDRLWALLEARPKWDSFEGHLLARLAKNAQPQKRIKLRDRRSELWDRGEKMVKDADPSRVGNLASVMTSYGAPERAIPLLVDALSQHTDPKFIARASYTLFRACMDVGDWRAAERIWPEARKRLQPNERVGRLGYIAVLAAKKGDRDDALRVWKKRMNFDLTDLRGLDNLAKSGLRDQLLQLYRQLAIDDPETLASDAALKRIAEGE
jgi:tetratricopeptide (TPR) repeat protein